MGFKDDKNEEFGGGARQRKAEQARIANEIAARNSKDIYVAGTSKLDNMARADAVKQEAEYSRRRTGPMGETVAPKISASDLEKSAAARKRLVKGYSK